jgi:NTP pyrophosphatase (non-canonical NTP hydrolase)
MPQLPEKPTLVAYQRYVSNLEKERGFAEQTVRDKCLLLGEEVGELFKAVRKAEGLKVALQSDSSEISHELVDIMIYIFAIANRYEIDLETAFREKEEINKNRIWMKMNEN